MPVRGNRKLRTVLERANADKQLKGWWHVSNVNAVARMEINDHSWVHIQIVANIALKLLRQLTKHGVEPSVVRDYGMSNDDAEVVVTLAALTHCVGMSIHRHGREDFSLFLAEPKLRELLDGIYEEPDVTVIQGASDVAVQAHVPKVWSSKDRPAAPSGGMDVKAGTSTVLGWPRNPTSS